LSYSLSAKDKEILKAARERRQIREIARQTLQGEAWDYLEQAAEDAAHNLAIINNMITEDSPEQLIDLQEDLEATHNKLQRLFDRLSMIETNLQRQEDPKGE
jgi:hypothetical protein